MYERLTKKGDRWEKREFVSVNKMGEETYPFNSDSLDCVIERFNRLAELEDKIEQGKLVEVLFKVGDTVYETEGVRIYEHKIDRLIFVDKMIIYDTPEIMFDERAVGYSIFPTREEAEKKLKELQEKEK